MSAPLRIVYTCHDAFPSHNVNTQQIFRTTLEVARLGVEVEVVVPWLAVPESSDARHGTAAHFGATGELPDWWTIRAVGSHAPRNTADRAAFDLSAPRHVRRHAADLVWTRDPVAALSCARAGFATVFETYRPDYATRPRFALWRRALLAHQSLRGVIVHTQFAARTFVDAGVPSERCLVAYNGFAPELMAPVLAKARARELLKLPGDRPLVVYTGHVARGPIADLLIDLARGVPEALLLVVGVDPLSELGRGMADRAVAFGVSNLVMHARVPAAAVAPYLYAADCLLVQPYDDPARRHRRHMLPIKVFSYLAAGRPVLAPRTPDLEEVLTDGETVCYFDLHAPDDAVQALRRLLGDLPLRERMSRNARRVAAGYTWSARAASVVPFLMGVANLNESGRRGSDAAVRGTAVHGTQADRSARAAAVSSRE